MTLRSCSRSGEVAVMLRRGYGPDAGDEDLRAHIRECSQCSQQVLLAQSFLEERRRSVEQAPLGSAQALWLRAQLRQRDAALITVRRPMALAQIFALTITAIVACGFLLAALGAGVRWLRSADMGEFLLTIRGEVAPYLALFGAGNGLLLALGLGAVALLGGLVYVASDNA